MTIELFPNAAAENMPDPKTPEDLLQARIFLHTELGRAASELCAAQERYNQLIYKNIEVNQQLKQSGLDLRPLTSIIQPAARADSSSATGELGAVN